MEFEQGLLYHVDGLLRDEAWGDFIISRIPESVRCQLNEKAQKNMLFASNSELRFVMEEETVTIVLRRLPVSGQIRSAGILEVFSGDYQGSYEISPGVVGVGETGAISAAFREIPAGLRRRSHESCFPTTGAAPSGRYAEA